MLVNVSGLIPTLRHIETLEQLLCLARDAQELAEKPRERRKLLAELAAIEASLERMQQRMTERALSDLLWRYLEFRPRGEEMVKRLLAEMAAEQ